MRQYRQVRIVHPRRRRCQQRGGFLDRYDFAYTGRYTVNQAFKNLNSTAPALMKQLTDQVNNVAQQRIEQIINQGGKEIERVAPKVIQMYIK